MDYIDNVCNNLLKNLNTNSYVNDLDKPLLISYENDLSNNINAKMFKKTLDNNKWEYLFVGEGKKWSGVRDKIIGYYDILNLLPDNKIVILTDARDVFCLRKPDFFCEKIKGIVANQIIVSAEMFLIGHMNWSKDQISRAISKDPGFFWQGEPLDNYWKFHGKETNTPFRKYVNSGLMVGKVQNLVRMFKWLIDNNLDDDQLGIARYINLFPELIYLDYNASILHTSTFGVNGSLYNHDIQKLDTPSISELIGLSSYFLHIPGINGSKGQKYIYDIIYNLFDKDMINRNMFELYGLKENLNNNNKYFITNDD